MKRRKWMHICKFTICVTIGLFLVACGTSNEGKGDQTEKTPQERREREFEKAKEEIENAQQDGQNVVKDITNLLSMSFCLCYNDKASTAFAKKFPNENITMQLFDSQCVDLLTGEFDPNQENEKTEITIAQVVKCHSAIKELESKSLEAIFESPKPFEAGMKQAGGECNAMMKKLEPYRKGR